MSERNTASCFLSNDTKALGFEEWLTFLVWATEASDFETTFRYVFCFSARGASSPTSKRTWAKFFPHEMDHLAWYDSELLFNGIKGCSILPSHFDDAVNLCRG